MPGVGANMHWSPRGRCVRQCRVRSALATGALCKPAAGADIEVGSKAPAL